MAVTHAGLMTASSHAPSPTGPRARTIRASGGRTPIVSISPCSNIGALDKGWGAAQANGWTVVDMKRDSKRIFALQ
jgi:hypothetical protein